MYAFPARLSGPKETSGTGKDTSVLTLLTLNLPVHLFSGVHHGAGAELCVGFDLGAPRLFVPWCTRLAGRHPAVAVKCHLLWRLSVLASGALFYPSNIEVHQRRERVLKIPFSSQKLIDALGSANWGMCFSVTDRCMSPAFKFRDVLSTALLWYYVMYWMEDGINHKTCLHCMRRQEKMLTIRTWPIHFLHWNFCTLTPFMDPCRFIYRVLLCIMLRRPRKEK